VIALLLEIGLLLLLIPWSRFWERNYFADLLPMLRLVMTNDYVRGAVSGLGLVNIWLAVADLAEVMTRRVGAPTPAAPDE
jgi:hypothetical protein